MLARINEQKVDFANAAQAANRVTISGHYCLKTSYADSFPLSGAHAVIRNT